MDQSMKMLNGGEVSTILIIFLYLLHNLIIGASIIYKKDLIT